MHRLSGVGRSFKIFTKGFLCPCKCALEVEEDGEMETLVDNMDVVKVRLRDDKGQPYYMDEDMVPFTVLFSDKEELD